MARKVSAVALLRKMIKLILVVAALAVAKEAAAQCQPSPTTASGTHAPGTICSGDLIFQDEFDFLDFKKWQHENTLTGGGVSIESRGS